MKTLLLLTCVVASALAAVFSPNPQSQEPLPVLVSAGRPALDPVVVEGGWEGAMTTFDEDSAAFRVKTFQEIESYARGAKALAQRCDNSRRYLQTRIKALHEHADHARAELLVLPVDEYQEDFSTAHARFYTTMNGLRNAFSQAMDEVPQ